MRIPWWLEFWKVFGGDWTNPDDRTGELENQRYPMWLDTNFPPLKVEGDPPRFSRPYPWWLIANRYYWLIGNRSRRELDAGEQREVKAGSDALELITDHGRFSVRQRFMKDGRVMCKLVLNEKDSGGLKIRIPQWLKFWEIEEPPLSNIRYHMWLDADFKPLEICGEPPRFAKSYPWWLIASRDEWLGGNKHRRGLTPEEEREAKACFDAMEQITDHGQFSVRMRFRNDGKVIFKLVRHP